MKTALSGALIIGIVTAVTVSAQPAPQTPAALVATATLEPLLPAPAGWTRVRAIGNRVVVSESCGYTFAEATFVKDEMKVRLMIADTGRNEEGLGVLATMVVAFPDGYIGTVPPATSIARTTTGGQAAASRWDAELGEGEFTILVDGRFVVKAEGAKIDDLATLRTLAEQVDLKKLAALK
jgi:hypothetical protein